jgi:hypothetical protein
MAERNRAARKPPFPWPLVAVLAACLFVAYVRVRVASVPLERDEGEYAYAGQLILQGFPPYSVAYNMKFPGTYYAYAAILAAAGQTPTAIHLGLLAVNVATIVLVFAVGRKLLDPFSGAAAAVAFAFLSVDRWPLGVFAHATHFVIAAATAGLLLLLHALDRDRPTAYAWSGLLFGVAVLMKQHAILFVPFAAAAAAAGSRTRLRSAAALIVGSILPLALLVAVLTIQGVAGRFWFWTFRYASQYASEVSLADGWSLFKDGLGSATTGNLALWIVAGCGLVALWATAWPRATRLLLTGWLAASMAAVVPGLYFRPHYFILLFPAMALLAAVGAATMLRLVARRASPGLALAAGLAVIAFPVGIYVVRESAFLFSMDVRTLSRARFGGNPFIEAVDIGEYIREHAGPDDRVAVLGSEPEIYFYARRRSATGYIYTYPLMEAQPYAKTMQQEMIREIEAAAPRWLVFCWVDVSWQRTPRSDTGIVDWARGYLSRCYDPIGVADIYSEEASEIIWDERARHYVGRSKNLVYTFERRKTLDCAVP